MVICFLILQGPRSEGIPCVRILPTKQIPLLAMPSPQEMEQEGPHCQAAEMCEGKSNLCEAEINVWE